MSSILTNNSAMNALSTLRNLNNSLDSTQNRISTGLKVQSGKDNASYFQISTTMSSESGMASAINESMTLAKNSISTARLGAETLTGLAQQFSDRLAFAQESGVDQAAVGKELSALVDQMKTTVNQSSFNGENLLAADTGKTVTTGITRTDGDLGTTTQSFTTSDLKSSIAGDFEAPVADDTNFVADPTAATFEDIAVTLSAGSVSADNLKAMLTRADVLLSDTTEQATNFGVAEKAIETQQTFLNELTDRIDSGVGSMVDANMEEEAARLQALQVQQQLATQSLSMANQKPQNILSLFR